MSATDSNSSENLDLAQRILDFVYHPQYQPLKAKGIHHALELTPDSYGEVRKTVKQLVRGSANRYRYLPMVTGWR